MGRRKKFCIFSCFTVSSASRYDPFSLNDTHCTPVPKPSQPSDDTRLATTNPQSTAPLATTNPQSTASLPYVPAEVQNHSPSIGPSDEPSSTSAEGSSSNRSSSVHEERYHTQQTRGAPAAVDPRNEEAYLDDLSDYVSNLLASIKGEGNKPSPVSATWPGSNCLFKLRDVLSDAAKISEALCPDAKTIAQRFLQGMGAVHILTTGFLVVANIMERCEKIKDNKKECESLLEKMNTLIQFVKELHKDPRLKEWMETHIEKAVKLIIEVTLACYTQTKQEKFIKFFSTTVNQEVLVNLKHKLTDLHEQIHLKMFVHLNNGIEKIHNSIEKIHNRKVSYPLYPERAYGIQKQVDNVIRLLEWESDETGIAVILYGLGGMGKTTLADAVFATVRDKENMGSVKYSFVRLFVNIGSVPKIPKLQNCILRDLNMGEASAIPEIPSYKEGQNEIAGMLKETEAFIYIDGVLFPEKVEKGRDAFEELLPTNMRNPKKLRLLITARDKGAAGRVCKNLGLKTNFYLIETLPDNEATRLVNEKLNGEEEIIDSRKIEQIVDICGGIPKLLIQVATFIRHLQDKQEAQRRYEMVISERENKWNGEIGKDIARYVFAYEYFDEILRDPFLDICSYFQGWQWKELSNIFEDFKLNSLENMALVTKDVRSMTARVHKVILAIGLKRTEGERFKFTSESEFQDFLKKTHEDLCGIKGIWSHDNIGLLDIPASKLDSMCGSLRVLALQNSTKVSGRCNRTFEELFFFSAQISDHPFDPSKVKKLRHSGYRPDDFNHLCQGSSNEESVEGNNDMQE